MVSSLERFNEDLKRVSKLLRGGYDLLKNPKHDGSNFVFNMNFEGAPDMEGFDSSGDHACGTACCIAGFLHAINQGESSHYSVAWAEIFYDASDVDAPNIVTMRDIFYPLDGVICGSDLSTYWKSITPKQAADTIDHYIETGEVEWERFAPPSNR